MQNIRTQLPEQRDQLFQRLAAHGQQHLLRFADVVDEEEFLKLAEDIAEVDFEQLAKIVALSLAPSSTSAPSQPTPLPSTSMTRSRDLTPQTRSELFASGLQRIASSEVALVILAGGQGTRLGTQDPKGCYDIGLPSRSSLFQLQIERTLKLSSLAGCGYVPVYIMTSPMTHAPTLKFFEDNEYFGCDRCATRVIKDAPNDLQSLTIEQAKCGLFSARWHPAARSIDRDGGRCCCCCCLLC
jgi:UDP-N-acetylglucosamine/UDP-N-acetylgalactosamine diphosphorylase